MNKNKRRVMDCRRKISDIEDICEDIMSSNDSAYAKEKYIDKILKKYDKLQSYLSDLKYLMYERNYEAWYQNGVEADKLDGRYFRKEDEYVHVTDNNGLMVFGRGFNTHLYAEYWERAFYELGAKDGEMFRIIHTPSDFLFEYEEISKEEFDKELRKVCKMKRCAHTLRAMSAATRGGV